MRPTLGGLYLALSLLGPLVAARPLAVEKERRTFGALLPLQSLELDLELPLLLPLVDLNRTLEVAASGVDGDAVNIVVLQVDGRPFGLIVEAINDTEEIVVKPLARQLRSLSLFSGTTIMLWTRGVFSTATR